MFKVSVHLHIPGPGVDGMAQPSGGLSMPGPGGPCPEPEMFFLLAVSPGESTSLPTCLTADRSAACAADWSERRTTHTKRRNKKLRQEALCTAWGTNVKRRQNPKLIVYILCTHNRVYSYLISSRRTPLLSSCSRIILKRYRRRRRCRNLITMSASAAEARLPAFRGALSSASPNDSGIWA